MALLDEIAREAQGRAKEAQERVAEAGHLVREAQERAAQLARERAVEAQERARRAAEALPPGLLVRVLSSIVGIPLLLSLVFARGPAGFDAMPFTGAVAITAAVGGWEYFRGLRFRGFQPTEGLAYIAIILLQFAAWSVSRGRLTAFLPALIACLVIATLINEILRHDREPLANIGVTFLGVVYVGWLFSYLIFLRSIGGSIDVFPFDHVSQSGFLGLFDWHARGAWLVCYVLRRDLERGRRGPYFNRNALR